MSKGLLGYKRPFCKEKVVFSPQEGKFYLVTVGPLDRIRPFTRISEALDDSKVSSASEERVTECVLSQACQRFGTSSILSDMGFNNEELGIVEFSELPQEMREQAIDRARKWCVGILDATEVPNMTDEELNEQMNELLDEMEEDEEVEIDIEDVEEGDEDKESLVPDTIE